MIARFAGGRLLRESLNLQNVYVQIKSFRWEDPMSTKCWILTQQAGSAASVAVGKAQTSADYCEIIQKVTRSSESR